jgi:uncharacterized protein YbjT (DUF2867 family)
MRVAVAGATGLVGPATVGRLRDAGHDTVPISAKPTSRSRGAPPSLPATSGTSNLSALPWSTRGT